LPSAASSTADGPPARGAPPAKTPGVPVAWVMGSHSSGRAPRHPGSSPPPYSAPPGGRGGKTPRSPSHRTPRCRNRRPASSQSSGGRAPSRAQCPPRGPSAPQRVTRCPFFASSRAQTKDDSPPPSTVTELPREGRRIGGGPGRDRSRQARSRAPRVTAPPLSARRQLLSQGASQSRPTRSGKGMARDKIFRASSNFPNPMAPQKARPSTFRGQAA